MKALLALVLILPSLAQAIKFNGYIVQIHESEYSTEENKQLFINYGIKKISKKIGNYFLADEYVALETLEKLKLERKIVYFEPNYQISIHNNNLNHPDEINTNSPELSDEYLSKQWAFKNTSLNAWSKSRIPGLYFPGKSGVDAGMAEVVHSDFFGRSNIKKEITIAIVDTGVDYTHKDLQKNIWVNKIERDGIEGVDDDNNGFIDDVNGYDFGNNDNDPMDDHGHGTHCAGIIAAEQNAMGIAGILNSVKVMPLKFLDQDGNGNISDAIAAIEYAISSGAQVLSNSWGGGGYSRSLLQVIKKAQDNGILFIAAAGNSRTDNDRFGTYPASYLVENILSVGAFNGRGNLASFSNFGSSSVHVMAPGDRIFSTLPNNKYGYMSGTSMAVPFVSAFAGFLLAQGQPFIKVKNALINGSVKTTKLKNKSLSSGRVNLAASIKYILNEEYQNFSINE